MRNTNATTPAERAHAGIRSWIRQAGDGLRTATPYGIVAILAASAVAPVAGAALGAPAEYATALDQLGGMGSNYLSDTLAAAARRLRDDETDPEVWREAVATELLTRLEAGDEQAAALRDEVAALLHEVDAVGVALRAADERGQQALALVFGALGEDVGRLQVLAEDAAQTLADIQRQLAEQGRTQRQHTDLLRQSLVAVAQLRQAVLRGTTVPGAEPATGGAEPVQAASPYPGLTSYRSSDARWFRGRESLVAQLLGRLSEHLLGGPPVVVVGVSGVGKSSLLHAGVLPAIADGSLGEDSGAWPWLVMTPGSAPLAELVGRTAGLADADSAGALAAVRDNPAGFGELVARAGGDGRLIIVVDQFEELFTQCPDQAERAAFAGALAAATPALVLLAVRADFYPQCTELAALVPMLAGQVVAGPLQAADLRRAIREPAAEAGLTVEPGLEELLLTDLGAPDYQPGALPLLAHALRATWERREGDTMTVGAYRRTGGIRRAVAETAERIYTGLDEAGRAALRAALLSLVTVVDDVPVRRRSTRPETDLTVLRPMIEARLVTTGRETVEISHEALLTGWPRLAAWLVEAREEILLRQRLGQAAADWTASGEDADALYRGARLAAAREWAAGRDDLPDVQRRFLAASEAAAHAQEMAQRRTNRRLRRLVAGLAVALLLVVTGAVVVWRQRVQADLERREATSRQLAAEARNDHWTEPDRSARRSLAAWQSARTQEARSALLRAQHTAVAGRLGSEPGASNVAVTADGRLVAVGFLDGRVQLWDSTSQQRVGPDLRHPAERQGGTGPTAKQPAPLMSLSFSPDGRYLAAGKAALEKGVAIWEVPSGRMRRTLPGAGAVAWLPDATAVLASRTGVRQAGQIDAWNPADGRVVASLRTGVPFASGLAVNHDGTLLAIGGAETGEIIRRADGRKLADLGSKLLSVGFAADNTLFGTGPDRPVRAWRPSAGWSPVTVSNPVTGDTNARLAVTSDGTAIVGGDKPRQIHALTLGGPRLEVPGYPSVPTDLALSGDDRLLVIVSLAAPPHLVRLGDQQLPHPQIVGHLAFDPTGRTLATGSDDPVIRIWDRRTGALRDTVTVPGDAGPLGLAYAPDGSLAASFADGRILVLDAAHRPRRTLTVPPELRPGGPAFSPDGSLLTVVTNYRTPDTQTSLTTQERNDPDVAVWDARTLQPRTFLRLPRHESITQAFTPDGRYLLVGSNRSRAGGLQDAAIWRYSLPDLSLVDRRDVPGDGMSELAVSPDSTLVALAHGRSAPILRVDGLTSAGTIGEHHVRLKRVAWSPDGRTLATATDGIDDVARLWDTGSGSLLAEVRANSNQNGQIAFSPDGSTFAAGMGDWTVTQWLLDPDDAVRRVCDMLVPASRHGGEELPGQCR